MESHGSNIVIIYHLMLCCIVNPGQIGNSKMQVCRFLVFKFGTSYIWNADNALCFLTLQTVLKPWGSSGPL